MYSLLRTSCPPNYYTDLILSCGHCFRLLSLIASPLGFVFFCFISPLFFLKKIPAFFRFIFVFSTCYNLISNLNWKKRRWCAWYLNLGQQDGRHERIHWAHFDASFRDKHCKAFMRIFRPLPHNQYDQKKLPNVYKSCPKLITLEKWYILTPLQNCLRMWEIWAK